MSRSPATLDLVETVDQIVANVIRLDQFASGTAIEKRFHRGRIKNGKRFVALQAATGFLFSPSKFAGYRENGLFHMDRLDVRHGAVTNLRINKLIGRPIEFGNPDYDAIDQAFLAYCRRHGIEPSTWERRRAYWLLPSIDVEISETAAGEVPEAGFYEGARKQVWVNTYERSGAAKNACLEYHGTACSVCEVELGSVYGPIGEGVIHVHHLVPISSVGADYRIDPKRDLRPVCPNCHAMLHRREPPYSIAKLRSIVRSISRSHQSIPEAPNEATSFRRRPGSQNKGSRRVSARPRPSSE